MKPNPVKAALRDGQPQIGTWLTLGDVFATRFLARTGFAWLTVDMEHAPIDWAQAGLLFGAIADAGCVPLARVPAGRHDYIKRVLDAGAHGIVAPMINTVEQAKEVVAACKYPPVGTRSVGGSQHAINFGVGAGDYYAGANDEILVVLQTESPEGVENADAIYSLPGVDAIFVGPNDLRAQMRTPDGTNPTPEEFDAMLGRILAAGQRNDTPVGIHLQSVADVEKFIADGWQFLACGSDLALMLKAASEVTSGLGLQDGNDLARY